MTKEAITQLIRPVGTRSHFIGAALTGIYLLGMGTLVAARWEDFAKLELNALGDFLAGAFGPIAFLWLVLGYMQQGRELRINSEALRLQAEELSNSVEQQKEIAEATKKQLTQILENHRANIGFDVSIDAGNSSTRAFWIELIFTNHGYKCTDIKIMIPNASRNYQSEQFQTEFIFLAALGSNQSHTEWFSMPIPLEHGEDEISISYRDGTGEQVERKLRVIKEVGTMNFLRG